MKEINVILDIDDLCPVKGLGLEKDEGEFRYINKLWEEFPDLKVTFFIPANYHNVADLRLNKDWVNWLMSKKNIEIACHGLEHRSLTTDKNDVREFFNTTPFEVHFRINECVKIFKDVGIDVKGIKAPGWDYIEYFPQLAFKAYEYIADHFIGTEPKKVGQDIYMIPYTYSIDDIKPKYHDTIILHGHISQYNGNKNGLNDLIYNNVRNYLKELESKFKVNYLTMSELLEKQKK